MSLRELPPKKWIVDSYYPNQALSAVLPGTCIGGKNVVFEAEGYSRTFAGWADQNETSSPNTLGYTASTTAGDPAVALSGGATALTDLVCYQHILIDRLLYLVTKIISNTSIVVSPTPTTSGSGLPVTRVPNLHELTRQRAERATLYAGNVIRYREEAIFAVGRGTLEISGSPLSASLTASDIPQVAYPIPGGTYDVRPVGFTRPAAPTVAAVAGGTKGMAAQRFTLRASKKRAGFPGYGLASAPVAVTLAAGQRIQVTFAAFDASEGQTSAYLWGSLNSDTTGGATWKLVGEFTAVGPHNVEWYDGELTTEYVDDNFPPPKSLFVVSANDHLLFCGCLGPPDGSNNPTAPGPGIAVSKSNNPESFPPQFYAFITPAEEIVGVCVGKPGARGQGDDSMVYFMSQSALNIGRFQSANPAVSPLICAPYGIAGFSHQYSGCVAYDYFYGIAGDTFIRTVDGSNIETEFSRAVHNDLQNVVNARSFVALDPKSALVVIFESNSVTGSGGGYQTKAWSFNTKTGKWNTPVLLGNGTDDFTVCGVASLNERLYFVTQDGKAWEWDQVGGMIISGFIAVGFDDFGASAYTKHIRQVKLNGAVGFNASLNLFFNADRYGLLASAPPPFMTYPSPAVRAYSNINLAQRHFPIWKPDRKFNSIAWRLDFDNSLANQRLLDSVDLVVAVRDGFVS